MSTEVGGGGEGAAGAGEGAAGGVVNESCIRFIEVINDLMKLLFKCCEQGEKISIEDLETIIRLFKIIFKFSETDGELCLYTDFSVPDDKLIAFSDKEIDNHSIIYVIKKITKSGLLSKYKPAFQEAMHNFLERLIEFDRQADFSVHAYGCIVNTELYLVLMYNEDNDPVIFFGFEETESRW